MSPSLALRACLLPQGCTQHLFVEGVLFLARCLYRRGTKVPLGKGAFWCHLEFDALTALLSTALHPPRSPPAPPTGKVRGGEEVMGHWAVMGGD